jgi:hypothetical protein
MLRDLDDDDDDSVFTLNFLGHRACVSVILQAHEPPIERRQITANSVDKKRQEIVFSLFNIDLYIWLSKNYNHFHRRLVQG